MGFSPARQTNTRYRHLHTNAHALTHAHTCTHAHSLGFGTRRWPGKGRTRLSVHLIGSSYGGKPGRRSSRGGLTIHRTFYDSNVTSHPFAVPKSRTSSGLHMQFPNHYHTPYAVPKSRTSSGLFTWPSSSGRTDSPFSTVWI
jgi:hypothetical protein